MNTIEINGKVYNIEDIEFRVKPIDNSWHNDVIQADDFLIHRETGDEWIAVDIRDGIVFINTKTYQPLILLQPYNVTYLEALGEENIKAFSMVK